jgi:hypothetical protein
LNSARCLQSAFGDKIIIGELWPNMSNMNL